jgi:NCS1 family nucleobase:cation symporter-1
VATLAGCFFAWIGLLVPRLHVLYDYAWFVGFGVAFIVHYALMKLTGPKVIVMPEADAA